jgi:hypothetical protein
MQTFFKYIIILCVVAGCSKVPDGYITDNLAYRTPEMIVNPGSTFISQIPDLNGSSRPVTFSLVRVKDSKGVETDLLTKDATVSIWKQAYDFAKDTTVASLMAKRKDSLMSTIRVNPVSGEIILTEASKFLEPLSSYTLDIGMENSAGKQVYENVVKIRISDVLYKKQECYVNILQSDGSIPGPPSVYGVQAQFSMKHTPKSQPPYRITLMLCDENGNAFNPNTEIRKRTPGLPSLTQFAPFSKVPNTDTSMVFEVPFTPFPFGFSPNGNYISYYQVPAKFLNFRNYTDHNYFANIAVGFQWLADGDWTLKVMIPGATRTP